MKPSIAPIPVFRLVCAVAFLIAVSSSGQAAIPQAERDALLSLYNGTNGSGWTTSTHWNGEASGECGWYGVVCDAGQTAVEAIKLPDNNLSGALPTAIGALSQLRTLDLSGNVITGTLPNELGSAVNLSMLRMDHNQLTGNIPATLGQTNLAYLILANNQLDGALPDSLANCVNLRQISLSNNLLSGPIPEWLGRLTNLLSLNLGANQFSGNLPAALGNLLNLAELSLYNNQLDGPIPKELGLTALSIIQLGNNQLSGGIPIELADLTNLNYLSLGFNRITGPIPPAFGQLTNLSYLHLGSNQLSGTIPMELGQLTKLNTLQLADNQLTGEIPPELGRLPSLTQLFVNNNQLTGSIPASLGQLANLTWLYAGGNRLSGPIPPALGQLASLQTLDLAQNRLTGELPAEWIHLTQLHNVRLSWNALHSSDSALLSFLQLRNFAATQTNDANGVALLNAANDSAVIAWDQTPSINYPGGYHVYVAKNGGDFTLASNVEGKSVTTATLTALATCAGYTVAVRSYTYVNGDPFDVLESDGETGNHLEFASDCPLSLNGGTGDFTLEVDAAVGTTITTLTVSSPANHVPHFSIVDGNASALFALNDANGVLSLAQPLAGLDGKLFSITVAVDDGQGHTVTGVVTIMVKAAAEPQSQTPDTGKPSQGKNGGGALDVLWLLILGCSVGFRKWILK